MGIPSLGTYAPPITAAQSHFSDSGSSQLALPAHLTEGVNDSGQRQQLESAYYALIEQRRQDKAINEDQAVGVIHPISGLFDTPGWQNLSVEDRLRFMDVAKKDNKGFAVTISDGVKYSAVIAKFIGMDADTQRHVLHTVALDLDHKDRSSFADTVSVYGSDAYQKTSDKEGFRQQFNSDTAFRMGKVARSYTDDLPAYSTNTRKFKSTLEKLAAKDPLTVLKFAENRTAYRLLSDDDGINALSEDDLLALLKSPWSDPSQLGSSGYSRATSTGDDLYITLQSDENYKKRSLDEKQLILNSLTRLSGNDDLRSQHFGIHHLSYGSYALSSLNQSIVGKNHSYSQMWDEAWHDAPWINPLAHDGVLKDLDDGQIESN